jgi:hypothetical protein
MKALNNNVILKRVEPKKNKGLVSSTQSTSNTTVLEVVDVAEGIDKKLIGKHVVVGKYAGEQHEDVLITPFSALLMVL